MENTNAIGRRKTAVARVYLTSGKGNIQINRRTVEDYFPTEAIRRVVYQPLQQVDLAHQYDIKVNVQGGGLRGQVEAIRLAIARALCKIDLTHRPDLKKAGYLTRDPRKVERKKYGHRKARKRFQFSKR